MIYSRRVKSRRRSRSRRRRSRSRRSRSRKRRSRSRSRRLKGGDIGHGAMTRKYATNTSPFTYDFNYYYQLANDLMHSLYVDWNQIPEQRKKRDLSRLNSLIKDIEGLIRTENQENKYIDLYYGYSSLIDRGNLTFQQYYRLVSDEIKDIYIDDSDDLQKLRYSQLFEARIYSLEKLAKTNEDANYLKQLRKALRQKGLYLEF